MKSLSASLKLLAVACALNMAPGLDALAQVGSTSDPYVGYLMVHFTGESAQGEQTYMATSTDGEFWTDLNNSQPVLMSTVGEQGVRDHTIVRSKEGNKFWILATDLRIASGKGWSAASSSGSTKLVIWESTDLVHWSAPRLADVGASIPGAGDVWAPEAIWDPVSNAYIVYWATNSPLNGITKHRIYYSKTTDFVTFTAAQLYIDRPSSDVIDTQILEIPDSVGGYKYVRASKDAQITFEGSQSVLGSWTTIGDLSQIGYPASKVEGPILYKFNNATKWGLLVDQYATGGGYLPFTSINMGSAQNWQVVPSNQYNLGADKKRHGSILNVTASEMSRLTTQWGGATPITRYQSSNYPDRYVRHANYVGRIDANVSPADDARFRKVKGLANNVGYVSFASVNVPGYYLRHKNYAFVLEPYDGSSGFASDATFKEVPGLADTNAKSYQSYNYTDRYIRHYNSLLRIDPMATSLDRADATFNITN